MTDSMDNEEDREDTSLYFTDADIKEIFNLNKALLAGEIDFLDPIPAYADVLF